MIPRTAVAREAQPDRELIHRKVQGPERVIARIARRDNNFRPSKTEAAAPLWRRRTASGVAVSVRRLGKTDRSATSGSVFLPELVDTAGGVHDLLLARVERMAARAHFDLQI